MFLCFLLSFSKQSLEFFLFLFFLQLSISQLNWSRLLHFFLWTCTCHHRLNNRLSRLRLTLNWTDFLSEIMHLPRLLLLLLHNWLRSFHRTKLLIRLCNLASPRRLLMTRPLRPLRILLRQLQHSPQLLLLLLLQLSVPLILVLHAQRLYDLQLLRLQILQLLQLTLRNLPRNHLRLQLLLSPLPLDCLYRKSLPHRLHDHRTHRHSRRRPHRLLLLHLQALLLCFQHLNRFFIQIRVLLDHHLLEHAEVIDALDDFLDFLEP